MADDAHDAQLAAGPEAKRNAGKLTVFVSYSRKDCLDFADQLAKALILLGHDPILDREAISGGEAWKTRLGDMILNADSVIFVLSPESAKSPICEWEVLEAQRLNKRILPVAAIPLGTITPPEALQALNYIHFYPDPGVPGAGFGHGLTKLDVALKSDLAWLREHRNILARAEGWLTKGRDPDRLMAGSILADAELWAASRPATAPDLTKVQREYLAASRTAQDAAAAARERELAEREKLVRQANADRDGREAAQKHAMANARRLTRVTLGGLGVALLLAVATGWFGVDASRKSSQLAKQKSEVERQRRLTELTESGLLANAVKGLLDGKSRGDPTTAALLTLEGLPDAASDDLRRRERVHAPELEEQLDRALRHVRERTVLSGHEGPVTDVKFSPDGKRVVTASKDGVVRVWEVASGKLLVAHSQTEFGAIDQVAWSRNGSQIFAIGREKAKVFDAVTGKIVTTFSDDFGKHPEAVFIKDDARILTIAHNGTVQVWESATGHELLRFPGLLRAGGHATWSPNGERIAIPQQDGLRVFDTVKGTILCQFGPNEDLFSYPTWSPDNLHVATVTEAGFQVWEPASGNQLMRIDLENKDPFNGPRVYWTADGSRIISELGRVMTVWNVPTGKLISQFVSDVEWPRGAFSSPDSTRIATILNNDGTIRLWDTNTGQETARLASPNVPIGDVQWSADGRKIVSAWSDNTAHIFDVTAENSDEPLFGSRTISVADWSPDGKNIVARLEATESGGRYTATDPAVIWDAQSRRRLFEITGASADGPVGTPKWNPTGSLIATAWSDGTARVWDVASAKQLLILKLFQGAVKQVSWSPNGTWISTTTDDLVGRIWDVATGKEWVEFATPDGERWTDKFSPDSKRVVTTSKDGARIWDVLTGRQISRFSGHSKEIDRIYWSPSGSRLLTTSDDETARIWEADTGRELNRFQVPTQPFDYHVSWMPDGNQITTWGITGLVKVWDANSGNLIVELEQGGFGTRKNLGLLGSNRVLVEGRRDGVLAVWDTATRKRVALFNDGCVSPDYDSTKCQTISTNVSHFGTDGSSLVSSVFRNGSVRFWRVSPTTDHLVQTAKAIVPRCLTRQQRAEYFLPLAPPSWCVERRLWPYHGDDWQTWLPKRKVWLATRDGPEPPLPKTQD